MRTKTTEKVIKLTKKVKLQKECLHILTADVEDGGLVNAGIYGTGEMLENIVQDLVPYLSTEGLAYLKKEMKEHLAEGWIRR